MRLKPQTYIINMIGKFIAQTIYIMHCMLIKYIIMMDVEDADDIWSGFI
jgi:hypothetical protein